MCFSKTAINGHYPAALRLEVFSILAHRREEVLGGGLGLRAVLEVENIFRNRRVRRDRDRGERGRQEIDALASGELAQCIEDFGVIRGRHYPALDVSFFRGRSVP